MSGGWSVSVTGMSTGTLMELYRLLKHDKAQALQIQKELVARAEAQGMTTQEILDTLVAGVGTKTKRAAIAKAWAEALRLTEAEARRRAG